MPPEASIPAGNCWKCGNSLDSLEYGRQDSCAHCLSDTHVCRNCVHHDRSCNNECREPQADRVVEKERSNFCDYFKPKANGANEGSSSRDALKAAADALFKKR